MDAVAEASKGRVGRECVGLVTSRAAVSELLKLDHLIDLVIPRGSGALVNSIKVEHTPEHDRRCRANVFSLQRHVYLVTSEAPVARPAVQADKHSFVIERGGSRFAVASVAAGGKAFMDAEGIIYGHDRHEAEVLLLYFSSGDCPRLPKFQG